MLSKLITFIPDLFKAGTEAYKTHKTIKAAKDVRKHELAVKKLDNTLEAIRNGQQSDMSMDENSNGRISWADDVSFAIFLVPCLAAFYPPALPSVQAGFVALGEMPEWYQVALGMMLVSVWGYRRIVVPVIEVAAKAYFNKK